MSNPLRLAGEVVQRYREERQEAQSSAVKLAFEVLRLSKIPGTLTAREDEKLQRLRKRAYHLQNRIDSRPRYELTHDKAELSALCWAIQRITGEPFTAQGGCDAAQPEGKS